MARAPDTPGRTPLTAHERALEALTRRGRIRELRPASGLDFTSNDYLGLAASPELASAAEDALARGVPLGAGGSRLLRGNHPEHEALEAEAAAFFGSEAALYFGSGFSANAALFATLPSHGDLIVHDALIHASAWEGMGLTKADCRAARHNDVQSFADAIADWRKAGGRGRVYIAVESLYSMDGDIALLAELAALAECTDAMLLIDEAHATGVLGPDGRGIAARHGLEGRDNVITLHTCGKALGASGALVTCSLVIRDFLVNRARAFIYATAPSPLMAAVVRRALQIVRDEPQRRVELAARVCAADEALRSASNRLGSGTQIVPVIVGLDANAVRLASAMQARGYDIRAIRPPTVPEGTARLRIAITNGVDVATIRAMMAALGEELAALPLSSPRRGEGGSESRMRGFLQTAVDVHGASPSPVLSGHPLPSRERKDAPHFVVTGTGTGIGKTVFAAALVQALGGDYWKPIQAGTEPETDTARVCALTGLPAEHFHAEAYILNTPASPHLAAHIDGVEIDPDSLEPPATERPLVIEGAGGLMVPLTRDTLLIDVLARWKIPVILVAETKLGTINHTLLSIEALRARGVPVLGVAFVGKANDSSEAIIAEHSGVRRLGRLDRLEALNRETLAAAFAREFDLAAFLEAPR